MKALASSTLLTALLLVSASDLAAQTPADTLPCDAWLATLANGDAGMPESEILYRIDGCERPDSVVKAAREAGTRALLARNDVGTASLYLSYLSRDSAWVANSFVPFVLPIATDKANSSTMRGQMLFLIARRLQPSDMPVGAVYVVTAGQTPGTSARCKQGLSISDYPPMAFSATTLTTIRNAAQAMIDDNTEVPQLREASRCVVRATNNPG